MATISNAVSPERISRIVGYKLDKGFFGESTQNLPARIAIFGEANEANQATLDTTRKQITTAEEAGDLYGYGSPIHLMARIILSVSSGVGGIPVIVYPQAKAVGATSKIISVEPSGTATKNGTHTLVVSGREGLDGEFYNISIAKGNTASDITAKISDAVNAILGAPVIGTSDPYAANLETKWKGQTADDLVVKVNTNGDDLGITYSISSTQSGAGTPSIQAGLDQIGNDWVTLLVNGYGLNTQVMETLETFNGRPDTLNPTGRYKAIVMKPFVALSGSTLEDPSSVTETRLDDVTIAVCPAPKSDGFQFEAAANMCVLEALISQRTPELDVMGQVYPDMPTPDEIGKMSIYNERDIIVKKGCSTVDLVGGEYQVEDFVTTYHKLGENPPQYRYVRNLVGIDFNVRYTYLLAEQINVIDHVIANDDDVVSAASKVVKPKSWKQVVFSLFDDLVDRGLIVDSDFSKSSLTVGISSVNPDRFETTFNYKRSGVARISSTTVKAGFNFGTL